MKLLSKFKLKAKHFIESNVIFCICAVGGYGRELLAPHSDLDLLFLFQKNVSEESKKKLVELFLFPFMGFRFKHRLCGQKC